MPVFIILLMGGIVGVGSAISFDIRSSWSRLQSRIKFGSVFFIFFRHLLALTRSFNVLATGGGRSFRYAPKDCRSLGWTWMG